MSRLVSLALMLGLAPGYLTAQVPYERLRDAASEPGEWLTYSGTYRSERF